MSYTMVGEWLSDAAQACGDRERERERERGGEREKIEKRVCTVLSSGTQRGILTGLDPIERQGEIDRGTEGQR